MTEANKASIMADLLELYYPTGCSRKSKGLRYAKPAQNQSHQRLNSLWKKHEKDWL